MTTKGLIFKCIKDIKNIIIGHIYQTELILILEDIELKLISEENLNHILINKYCDLINIFITQIPVFLKFDDSSPGITIEANVIDTRKRKSLDLLDNLIKDIRENNINKILEK